MDDLLTRKGFDVTRIETDTDDKPNMTGPQQKWNYAYARKPSRPTPRYWLYTTLGITGNIVSNPLPLTIKIFAPISPIPPADWPDDTRTRRTGIRARIRTGPSNGSGFVYGRSLSRVAILESGLGVLERGSSINGDAINNSMILLARHNKTARRRFDRLGFGWIKNLPLASTLSTEEDVPPIPIKTPSGPRPTKKR